MSDDTDASVTAWFRLADEDLAAAEVVLSAANAVNRVACFLAQQAAEKVLKAGLMSIGIEPPRTHDIVGLGQLFLEGNRPQLFDADLEALTPWVIDGRYAADLPEVDRTTAEELLSRASRTLDAVQAWARREVEREISIDESGRED